MNIQQRIYEDAQRASGLQVGDWVRVVDPEMNFGESWGSTFTWSGIKEKMIGQLVQITNILEDGIQINNDFIFPYFALEKLSYKEAQKVSGLKIGDWVKITRKAENKEGGWEEEWNIEMDENVEKTGVITKDFEEEGFQVYIPDGKNINSECGYAYPFFVLEKVPAPEPENKEHEFKPFDKVLVRDGKTEKWRPDIFSYDEDGCYQCFLECWNYCIPYEGNEHLVGTTDMPE